ncbi:MAG: hypothetical protein GY811_11470 [Myxococcales bacterium]|nr:hypothetical protein [Myxococcales bacterium]
MATTNIRKTLLSLLLGCSSAAAIGCASDNDGYLGDDFCADQCEPVPPISGNAIVDCWVTPAGSVGADLRLDALECRYEPPTNYPATLDGATIHGFSAAGEQFSANIETAEASKVLRMASIDPDAYPIEISMDIRFDTTDRRVASLQGLEHVRTTLRVNNSEQIAVESPASANIPFELWEVNLLGRDTDFSGLSFGYPVQLGRGEVHNVTYKSRPLLFGRSEQFYLPVNPGVSAVDAKLVFESGDSDQVSFTGPGDYAVRSGEMLRAESADFPQLVNQGSALAACWFDSNSIGSEQLFCRANENRGFNLDEAVIILDTVNGKTDRVVVGPEPTLIATVSPAAFPMQIRMEAPVQAGIIGLESLQGSPLQASMVVSSAKELPRAATRQTLRAPFEVWQATIENQTEGFEGSLNDYVIELGAGTANRFASHVEQAELPEIGARSEQSFLVASPAGQLEMKGTGSMLVGGELQEIDFVLSPGVMVVGE